MTITRKKRTTHELTIQVDPQRRRILQMRKKYNAAPTAQDLKYLDLWTSRAGLVRAG